MIHKDLRGSVSFALASFLVAALAPERASAAEQAIRACTRPAAGFFERGADGAPAGLEYDILKSFADAVKADLVIEDAPSFDELLTRVEGGRCHIAASAITVTAERRKRFLFSTPYFPNRVVVVQRVGGGLLKPEDLNGQRVAVVGGTLQARLLAAVAGVKVVTVNDDDALFDRMNKGEADALVCDSAVVLHHLTKRPEFSTAFPLGDRSFFAFAMPRDSSLARALNEHLKTLAKTGEFTRMLARHFGEANADFLASEIADNAGKRP